MKSEAQLAPLAVTIREASKMTSLSEWILRENIKAGKLRGVRIGRRVLITIRELERFVNEGTAKV